jgi:coenzyme F420-reducing hydrogenase gamma subunit
MKRPRLGIFKLTSCEGCQLSILNLEEDLLRIVELFSLSFFREASDKKLKGYFDLSLVEGSISEPRQKEQIIRIRERSRYLITIGACATSGGLQALKNWAVLESFKKAVYPDPALIESLSTSTPVSDHVYVDYEIWGCPVTGDAVSETLACFLIDKRPTIPQYSLCMECKRKAIPCILVSRGEPCLGPITKAGCGALCPLFDRACYGCFGPRDDANIDSLMKWFEKCGYSRKEERLLLDTMNTYAYRRVQIEKKD